jgi:endonuclease/exonuclease/phosphatase family metal-dependent hydrolase
MTLNLHGYHPMGEAPRWLESPGKPPVAANSDIFFFTPEEYSRGDAKRIQFLARDISRLRPDVVFLQEVGAGRPDGPKDCETFRRDSSNTARRLTSALGVSYRVSLACRGNTGWQTDPGTFRERRILRQTSRGFEIVFDYGANPYPRGILVEGTAILARDPWRIVDEQEWRLRTNFKGDVFFAQAAVLRHATSGLWLALANVHAGHKIHHFEQSLALRSALEAYVQAARTRFGDASHAGTLVAGDFNARLFRPASPDPGEASTAPWEIAVPGQFDFRASLQRSWREPLRRTLTELNSSTEYKPWASIQDRAEASRRIDEALAGLALLENPIPLREALDEARRSGRCAPASGVPASCAFADRIDLIFADPGLGVRNSFVVYPENDWSNLRSVSDHPAVAGTFELGR